MNGERCEVCGAPAVRGSGNLALAVCAKHEARECRCGGVIVPDGCDTFSDGDTLHAVNDCEAMPLMLPEGERLPGKATK